MCGGRRYVCGCVCSVGRACIGMCEVCGAPLYAHAVAAVCGCSVLVCVAVAVVGCVLCASVCVRVLCWSVRVCVC